jgi:hypothetical protein
MIGRDKELVLGITDALDDESMMVEFDAQFKALGYLVDEDYYWAIAMGDDLPHAFMVKSQRLQRDEEALKILEDVEGSSCYDEGNVVTTHVVFGSYDQAWIFLELLTNAGWADDADELIADHLKDMSRDEVEKKLTLMQDMINQANYWLSEKEEVEVDLLAELKKQVG